MNINILGDILNDRQRLYERRRHICSGCSGVWGSGVFALHLFVLLAFEFFRTEPSIVANFSAGEGD